MEKYTHILSFDERYQRLEFLQRSYINCLVDAALEGDDVAFWAGLLRVVSSVRQNMILMRTGIVMPIDDILRV